MSNSVLQKRKRSVATLDTKMKIIGEVKEGSSQKFVADKYGVAKSTVSDIWKDREKIENSMSSVDSVTLSKKRCIVRQLKFDLVDSACWQWFCQQHLKGAPVSGVLLLERARLFFTQLYPSDNPQDFKGVQNG